MKYQTILLKQFFGLKGVVFYEAIATVKFSHVKISSFRMKAHLVFHWCLFNNNDSLTNNTNNTLQAISSHGTDSLVLSTC